MNLITDLLGIPVEPKDLTIIQVSCRAAVIFLYCVFLVRMGDKRFLSRKSAFDAVLGFVLASMMARAINGSSPFVPTLVAGAVLMLLHRFLSYLSVHSRHISRLIKGRTDLVVENGELRLEGLRRNNFSEDDLMEDLRLNGLDSIKDLRAAYIERSGELSVLKRAN